MRSFRKSIVFGVISLITQSCVAGDDPALLRWQPWAGRVPANAVGTGEDRDQHLQLYVCRAPYNGGVHPGKLLNGHCNIGWGGQEIVLDGFEVLVSSGGQSVRWHWDPHLGNTDIAKAYIGGSEPARNLAVCMVPYWTGDVPESGRRFHGFHAGKFIPESGKCNFGWGGKEVQDASFSMLRLGAV